MIAINDTFILESAIYFFLKKYFRQDPYYIDLVDLFHEVNKKIQFIFIKFILIYAIYIFYRPHLKLN